MCKTSPRVINPSRSINVKLEEFTLCPFRPNKG
uniref:Uncharacterized protein n=1 Tax=Anopheles quadriannulatus TaxID=34691 RepID=A0A182XQC0_ANOQN